MIPERLKSFYNTILCQTISSDGCYLFAGNNFGEIFVYNISHICTDPIDNESHHSRETAIRPIQIFKIVENGGQIHSLAFHNNFVIVGSRNASVTGYSWVKNEITKKAWEVKLSSTNNIDSMDPKWIEVNSFWLDKENGILYAGCGDNQCYAISLENGKIIREFDGHKDYIHCVHGLPSDNRIFTASEDGTVKFWDVRTKQNNDQLEPFKNDDLHRPQFGKWQGTVSVTDDWILCGGGPRFSLWHMRSLQCTTIYDYPGTAHVSGFLDDNVCVAGNYANVCQFSLNGDVTSEIPVSGPAVYSVVWQNEPFKLMSIAGASKSLDICTDFNYKDIVLNLYGQ
ncbi:THO complex subunit 6 [Pseudolycoriella hygida]|uniref:THO complex subunit 6 n=1 Tax=Pseudolycoriella hygida TaxID=35572 RepID=A0A9Q0N552_9DIPT|nr:THO complex subunit 6 [Pseudolycoriella hygida]